MQDDDDPYNGKLLLAAVICLSAVVIFVILLHAYGRWLLRGRTTAALTELHLPVRWIPAEEAEEAEIVTGLDAKLVAALPEFVYRATEQQGKTVDCVFCLSSMKEGETGRILPRCGHGFHSACIDTWLTEKSTCPICRTAVAALETEEVVVVVDSGVFPAEVDLEMPVSGGQEYSSSSPATASSSCSVKRMLSKSRSDNRVFPSALDRVHVQA